MFSIGQGQPTLQSTVDQILNSIKGCNSVANLKKKMMLYNPNVDLVKDNVYTNFLVEFCPFILKIWSKIQILASIKGRNFVANLR